ncbi:hypothetical protein LDENG_00131070 [Lucifuga dentata]|nr:hypothetical protein LDENG_00131070 [Lucifuga dentata]
MDLASNIPHLVESHTLRDQVHKMPLLNLHLLSSGWLTWLWNLSLRDMSGRKDSMLQLSSALERLTHALAC